MPARTTRRAAVAARAGNRFPKDRLRGGQSPAGAGAGAQRQRQLQHLSNRTAAAAAPSCGISSTQRHRSGEGASARGGRSVCCPAGFLPGSAARPLWRSTSLRRQSAAKPAAVSEESRTFTPALPHRHCAALPGQRAPAASLTGQRGTRQWAERERPCGTAFVTATARDCCGGSVPAALGERLKNCCQADSENWLL